MNEYLKSDGYDVVVIGGGPAGLAGAVRAGEMGLEVTILENRDWIGGIPIQCVHPGFGNFYFNEDLTGPEFSYKLIEKLNDLNIDYHTNTHVKKIVPVSDLKKKLEVVTPEGVFSVDTSTIIYATGARERHLYETGINGDRVGGVYTAGEAQTLMDIDGVLPGKEVVVVGSGDVGLIVARRFALEGAEVKGVMEMLPYPGGLTRNVAQCLRDFDIPLYKRRIVKKIIGNGRVEKVITADLDEDLKLIEGTETEVKCDTVALATGLIPYTKILDRIGVTMDPSTRGPVVNGYLETSSPGIFAAGNVITVNDYVDYVADQGELAAEGANLFIENEGLPTKNWISVEKGRNVNLVVPQFVSGEMDTVLYARVEEPEIMVTVKIPEIEKEISKRSVNPGEMIKIELEKEDFDGGEDKITIEVVN